VLEKGTLVGVISRTDLLRALVRKLISSPAGTTDAAIGDYIKAELAHAAWAPKSGVRVTVKDKAATLEGTVFSDAERRAVVVIAENAPGVKTVTDHLVFVDPVSGLAFPAESEDENAV
jgi:osmotically-inducible protein OsmY